MRQPKFDKEILSGIEFDKINVVDVAHNGIDFDGVVKIRALLLDNGFYSPFWYSEEVSHDPDNEDFAWVWQTKRGNLVKRLGKYCRHHYGQIIPSQILSLVGNIAAQHSNKVREYYISASYDLDWKRGKFGDSGSCYWTCRDAARHLILLNGGFALQEFRRIDSCGTFEGNPHCNRCSEDCFEGFSRCWCWPTEIKGERVFVIWNSYSQDSSRTILQWARILGTTQGLSYRKIDLECNECTDGTVWINGDSYIVGPGGNIAGIDSFDLEFRGENELPKCRKCSNPLNPGTLTEVFGSKEDSRGYHYCHNSHQDCYSSYADEYDEEDEETAWCELCECGCPQDEVSEYNIAGTQKFACNECIADYRLCYCCSEYRKREDVQEVDDYYVCEDCLEYLEECSLCGKKTPHSLPTAPGVLTRVCTECASEKFAYCPKCRYYHNKEETVKYESWGTTCLGGKKCIEDSGHYMQCKCGMYVIRQDYPFNCFACGERVG